MDVRQLSGANVRRLRRAKGLSQEEFGFHAGIDRTYVSAVERGVGNPTIMTAQRFADGLGAPVHELFMTSGKESGLRAVDRLMTSLAKGSCTSFAIGATEGKMCSPAMLSLRSRLIRSWSPKTMYANS
ncbi:helix-turn-helix domain-containing protein [Altererythrobacter aurantiacus]|uniref:Helix-turn-helix domain-containing protein n=2 Tax=Parapontixanthobacter aurantiacus TaxID=1463599 RepID=A0A844ZLA6_9SPHN|nr:helix-turn-helix transcriptional regulator [Parapontixanthobacter aurantiacus]MXO86459.1 helix-turn-helix domain-containing protein [Parapontixanthobacter aurantiacus]